MLDERDTFEQNIVRGNENDRLIQPLFPCSARTNMIRVIGIH
jgi:hypothetical protein